MEITNEGFAVVSGDTHIGLWVKENKRLDFDYNTIPLIMEHINHSDVVIDVGANIGAYAYAFANKTFVDGAVICFEPNIEAFECLKYNLGKYDNVFCINNAVGDKYGKVNLVKNPNVGASHCEFSTDGTIDMVTIDSYNMPKVNFIKLDCEGFELHALRGAIKTIQRDKPKMYIEINEGTLNRVGVTSKDIFEFLDCLGYTYSNIYPKQPMGGAQYDIICTPKI